MSYIAYIARKYKKNQMGELKIGLFIKVVFIQGSTVSLTVNPNA